MVRLSKELDRKYANDRYFKMCTLVLDTLGGRCCICGQSDYDVLQIDHIIPILKSSYKRKPNIQLFFHILNGKENK
jgi:hypothetical protein